jgi:hypothetical protein
MRLPALSPGFGDLINAEAVVIGSAEDAGTAIRPLHGVMTVPANGSAYGSWHSRN